MTPDSSVPETATRPPAVTLLGPLEEGFLAAGFRELLPMGADLERHLAGVLADALRHPGSLARAQLAFAVLSELAVAAEPARELAIAIEYFHTASLLFDDLPAMDDARERRGRACPHVVWGEAATMLGALGLINQGYRLLWRVIGQLPPERGREAAELVTACLGTAGILDGQARDLHFAAATRGLGAEETVGEVQRVAEGKTVPLVRLALVLPALVGGASGREVELLDRLARAWGLAYQGIDDAKDGLLAPREAGKSTARDRLLGRPNLPAAAGWNGALARLEELLAEAGSCLDQLAALRPAWGRLGALSQRLADDLADLESRRPGPERDRSLELCA
ncbi:MAG TPA: polyprenyl synthetase family protein [Thermoanaerobaculia bacterium]|nr:polyprenyl synthetase family protein [Thermoanaerobaculia bacterium]